MKNFKYEQTVKLFLQIIKNDILNIMNKQKKFNAFNINKILNVFFKTIKKSFAKIITIFIQTFQNKIKSEKKSFEIRQINIILIRKNT